MPTTRTVTLQISDIIEWDKRNALIINDMFQRHAVWTPSARTYLIDTILNELPLPKLFLRTKTDPESQSSVREIVDGQQRIRAILAFAKNELRLTSRSEQFSGMRYSDLDEELQEVFLSYPLVFDQLLNASDDDVIDVFARLNSYTVALNPAEKRHAKYQTDFKHEVRRASQEHRGFIEKHKIFTTKQRFRMADDTFFAEVFGVLLEGVTDGGAEKIGGLYQRQTDERFAPTIQKRCRDRIKYCIDYLDNVFADILAGPLGRHYQMLMSIAAIAHSKWGIEKGSLKTLPRRKKLRDKATVRDNLLDLSSILESEDEKVANKEVRAFIEASRSSTQRIASRRARFPLLYDALTA